MLGKPLPQRGLSFLEKFPPPASMHCYTTRCDLRDDVTKTFTNLIWRAGPRFLDINRPSFVQTIRKINLNARELRCFAFRHHAEPVAPGHQPAVAVDVGSLVRQEVAPSNVIVVLVGTQARMVRQDVRLDVARFTKDLDDPALDARLDADKADAEALKVKGTPTFFVNGHRVIGAQPLATFEAAAALK